MNADLVAQAQRRARLAALCGWLVLAEPGVEVAEHVAGVPALRRLADPALAVDYERIFVRTVAPYESVFRSADGAQGGAIAAALTDAYDELGFTEHILGHVLGHSSERGDRRWRVGGPDHLGLELRCYATLCASEAAAWEHDRPDEAAAAVAAERRFLAEHLAAWADVALDAVARGAGDTPYADLVDAVRQLLADEIDLLRPAPMLADARLEAGLDDGLDDEFDDGAATISFGPARLARHLLAPARCGFWLDADSIGAAARALGFPWRPVDGRSRLRQLIEAADDAGDLAALVAPLADVAVAAHATFSARQDAQPGAALLWARWATAAAATVALLDRIAAGAALAGGGDNEVTLRVSGRDAARAAALLRAAGLDVEGG